MKKILVSSAAEAMRRAKGEFDKGEDFVLAEGAATAGGAAFEMAFGSCLMHKSGQYVDFVGDIDAARQKLIGASSG